MGAQCIHSETFVGQPSYQVTETVFQPPPQMIETITYPPPMVHNELFETTTTRVGMPLVAPVAAPIVPLVGPTSTKIVQRERSGGLFHHNRSKFTYRSKVSY